MNIVTRSIACTLAALFATALAVRGAEPVILPGGYRVEPVADAATVTGRIELVGERPSADPIPVTADRAVCGPAFKTNEAVLSGRTGGLGNCVASFEDIRAGKAPAGSTTEAVMDQQACVFTPHVLQAWAGASILVKNSDPVYHNVHAYSLPGMYTRFNVGLPQKGNEVRVQAGRPEMLVLKCDAGHRWMTAYIHVAPNPYHALTEADGAFTIGGVPAGRHKLRLWHELAGEFTTEVECPKGATVPVAVTVRLRPTPLWSVAPQAQPLAPIQGR